MKIIDARSGREVKVGDSVFYPPVANLDGSYVSEDPDNFQLLDVVEGPFSAHLTLGRYPIPSSSPETVKVPVHYFHPGFLAQKVAFIPS